MDSPVSPDALDGAAAPPARGALDAAEAEAAAWAAADVVRHQAERRRAALLQARARILDLREQVAPLEAERAARLAAEQALAEVLAERARLLASTSWRLTGPLRRLTRATPARVRLQARRAAKLAWWAATPWRLPRRLRDREQRLAAFREQAALPEPAPDDYQQWIATFEPPPLAAGEAGHARVAVLMPGAGPDDATAATLASLLRLAHADWSLVVPDLPEARAGTAALRDDSRLVRAPCAPEADRGGVLAALLAATMDDWALVLDPGDLLPPHALQRLAAALEAEPGAVMAYADEDVAGPGGRRVSPQFKPGWSPELLTAYNYVGRPAMFSTERARACGGFAPGSGAGADWALNLRLAEAEGPVLRVPAVLCHRGGGSDRPAPGSRAASEHRTVLLAHWQGRGHADVQVETRPDGTHHATWSIPDPPLVSVIIPNRNSPSLLRRVLKGVLERTDYRAVEVVIVENNSDEPETLAIYGELPRLGNVTVVRKPGPFNYSAACNFGARHARGALLLFLNNDIEVERADWLHEMVRVAMRPGVGVVGAKLRYPDRVLQHAGVAAGPHLLALMYHRAIDEDEWGVFGSAGHVRNWSAIMGACQMVRRDAFDQVGGFDEGFQLANSDVLLCMRAGALGWRTVYTPHAALVHHEGATRGRENPAADMARTVRELRRLGIASDPFLHPGLSGDSPIPRLRRPGEPSPEEALAALSARFLAAAAHHGAPLDLFDDAAVLAAFGKPRSLVLPRAPGVRACTDAWEAAAWVITLLRARADLRMRFPHALGEGAEGEFARWLARDADGELALPPGLGPWLGPMWALEPATRPLQIFAWRDDVQRAIPAAFIPPGTAEFGRFLFWQGPDEYGLRPKEAWWFLLRAAEQPAAELVRTWRFTPDWQLAHPLALTVFGRDAFATWVAERYALGSGTGWLVPATWPDLPTPADQLRLAYAHHPEWRRRHPDALRRAEDAAGLLDWLAGPDGGQTRPVRAWCGEQAREGAAAALAGLAVTVLGHFSYPSGLRVSAEAVADALRGAGAAVSCRDIRVHLRDDPPHMTFGGLEAGDISIVHTQPGDLFVQAYERAHLAPRAPRAYRIGYWYWELGEAPEEWARIAEHADEIWTATEFVAGALRRVVKSPVRVMFPGVRIPSFTPMPREALGVPARGPEGRFAFLFAFHMASITERKNPWAVIRAFRRAFTADDRADLVIKVTYEERHEAELAALRAAAQGGGVTILDRVFSPGQTLALIDACDAYVSLHRAEGLGLGMAEAMLLGKPVIATRYSGNLHFMDDDNSLLVDCSIVPIGREVPPYPAVARWAEPSVAHAARLMRQLYDDRDAARALGERGRASARARLSLETAGRAMAARLEEIRATWPGPGP